MPAASRSPYPFLFLALVLLPFAGAGQVVINEGSSRNAATLVDADGDHPDWIELYNAGTIPVDLAGYTLSDDVSVPAKWLMPSVVLPPQGFLVVFCSGKDRTAIDGLDLVGSYQGFTPTAGWNTHTFSAPFEWDGSSNLLVDVCVHRTGDPTLNALFRQAVTYFPSSAFFSNDATNIEQARYGTLSYRRPVVRLNGTTIGDHLWQNSSTEFPAPYSNWRNAARHTMLFQALELQAAGLTAGPITELAFDLIAPNAGTYDRVDIRMTQVEYGSISAVFLPANNSNELHTNFKLSRGGETVYLYSPTQEQLSSLHVEQEIAGHSNGSAPDGGATIQLFAQPTPGASNNAHAGFAGYSSTPTISPASCMSDVPLEVTITDPTIGSTSVVRYTVDGSEPTESSAVYSGPLTVGSTVVLKARTFTEGMMGSKTAAASYLIEVAHTTPVLSVTTAITNLYGPDGIFTNWWLDDERPTHVDYFDEQRQLVFSQRAGMQVDGGNGGSRGFQQHSFRVELDHDVYGQGSIDHVLIPDRPERTRYSKFYLRNGSNQYLIFPHKDATQVKAMAGATNNYYSAWRPVTVYINGAYFGLYELREKFDAEYFGTLEQADEDSMDVLSLSSWNGGALRPLEGDVDPFWQDVAAFNTLDPTMPDYWEQVDQRFDLTNYTDYIIAATWMGTTDWPYNNIKIYRSNTTGGRWRFCTTDLETAMAPNGQTGPAFNGLNYITGQDGTIPYTNIWQRSIANPRFHDHFINRYADVMNSAYLNERVSGIAQEMFDLTRPEMGREFARWTTSDTTEQVNEFEANHEAFLADLAVRTPIVRDQVQDYFDLPRQVDMTLDVHPPGAGKIHISTLVPGTYPWEGVYFDGVPVSIEAVAEEGYYFSHWTSNELIADTLNAAFLDTLATDAIRFDAHFLQDISTALPPNASTQGCSLQPNPAHDHLELQVHAAAGGSMRYRIMDDRGVLVREGRTAGQRTSIPLHGIHSGPYQVFLTSADGAREVLRFIKL